MTFNTLNFRSKILDVNAYMKEKNISSYLQMKVRRYIEYKYNQEKFGYIKRDIIIESLSKSLKHELFHEAYFKILKKIPIFEKFTNSFLIKLAQNVNELTFGTDQVIYNVLIHNIINEFFFL